MGYSWGSRHSGVWPVHSASRPRAPSGAGTALLDAAGAAAEQERSEAALLEAAAAAHQAFPRTKPFWR
ncbi:MAG: hypothetical protein JWR86_1875 [Enterovirga sp.]|nr:hypothetical protein [Enterovirga sp.]